MSEKSMLKAMPSPTLLTLVPEEEREVGQDNTRAVNSNGISEPWEVERREDEEGYTGLTHDNPLRCLGRAQGGSAWSTQRRMADFLISLSELLSDTMFPHSISAWSSRTAI